MNNKPYILIVDDSPTNIQILAASLKDKYQLKIATNGEMCIQIATQNPFPDLILLDVEMPGISGYDVCKKLKSSDETKSIPIIFVTGRQANEDEERGLKLGAVDYITKPIHPAIVSARVSTHITLKLQRDKLEKMALHDQLTGLYNRHYMLEIAKQKMAKAIRYKYSFCLIMIDIDHFKSINDTHGHLVGDIILDAVAKNIGGENRSEDIVARFGGEEFLILLDHCTMTNAEIKANSIRENIENLCPNGIKVTISLGVSEFRLPYEKSFDELLKQADDALYKAKREGRNRVVVS